MSHQIFTALCRLGSRYTVQPMWLLQRMTFLHSQGTTSGDPMMKCSIWHVWMVQPVTGPWQRSPACQKARNLSDVKNQSLFVFFFIFYRLLCPQEFDLCCTVWKFVYLTRRAATFSWLVILNEKSQNHLVPSFLNWNIFRFLYSSLGCGQNETFQDVNSNISYHFLTFHCPNNW